MKKIFIVLLLIFTCVNAYSLTEEEEFELYKEFKQSKKQQEVNTTGTEQSNQGKEPVNVIINNNLSSDTNSNNLSKNNAFYFYDQQKKAPLLGAGLAYIFPTAGHFYAGDWGRGLPFFVAEVIGLALISTAYEESEYVCEYSYDYYYDDYTCGYTYEEDYNQVATGVAILLIAKIWEIFDAYDAVEDYNMNLRRALNLNVGLTKNHELTAGLQYNF